MESIFCYEVGRPRSGQSQGKDCINGRAVGELWNVSPGRRNLRRELLHFTRLQTVTNLVQNSLALGTHAVSWPEGGLSRLYAG